MSVVNAALRGLFDALLYPFRDLPPLVGLSFVSLLTAVGMLWVFKKTSDQERLAAVKRRIHAGLFEIRLFNDDLRAIARAQLDILRHNGTYIRLSLVPLLVILPPLVLAMAQLQFHYGYAPFDAGQKTLVTAVLRGDGAASPEPRPAAALTGPAGVRVEAGPVWAWPRRELVWRIVVDEPGDHELRLTLDGEEYTKSLATGGRVRRRSPVRVSGAFVDQLLYPAEPPLPDAGRLESIAVGYPGGDLGFVDEGSEWLWIVVYFALSIVFAFALRKPLGVTI